MKYKLVTRKVDELKPDPNQPRKSIDDNEVKNMAKTIDSQGVINPIEIDGDNMIITGEMRWRASKEAGLEEIECKLFESMNKWERLERQTVENLHHNMLTSEERENIITKLWGSGKYETKKELSDALGYKDQKSISRLLISKNMRKKNGAAPLSTRSLYDISRAPKEDQEKIIEKVSKGDIKPSEIREYVSMLQEAPKDIKTEILKPDSELELKDAEFIADFSDPNQRKDITDQIKRSKQTTERILEEKKEIAEGKEEPPVVDIVNEDQKQIESMKNIFFQIKQEFRDENIKEYGTQAQKKCIEIMRRAYKFIFKECEKYGKRYME